MSLSAEEQMEVVKGLAKHLVNQGVVHEKVLGYLGEQMARR